MNRKIYKPHTEAGLSTSNGWWNRIEASDLDHDGDIDFVCGQSRLEFKI